MEDRRNYTEILTAVREAVRDTVNGKIDNIDKKLDKHIDYDRQWKDKIDRQNHGTISEVIRNTTSIKWLWVIMGMVIAVMSWGLVTLVDYLI